MRVNPPFSTMKLQARNAQTDKLLVLFWRKIAGQSREPSLGVQSDYNFLSAHVWEHRHQSSYDLIMVDDQRRIRR